MKHISTKNLTRDQWLQLRNNSIGGSDAGTIMGLNPYKSKYELYLEKTGIKKSDVEENTAMFFGNFMENTIADLWEYWGGNMESTIKNYNEAKIQRRCMKRNAILYSEEYPFISANVDRIIIDEKKGRGILEIKTISGWSAQQYEGGIPPQYYIQIQQYLFVTGYKYAELAILKDGRDFDVLKFDRDEELISQMIEKEQEFWNLVTKTKECIEKHEDYSQYIPEPDNSESLKAFMAKEYKAEEIILQGSWEDYQNLCEVKKLQEKIKELNSKILEVNNRIQFKMKNANKLDFGQKGYISWKANKNGVRTFLNNVKLS